MSSAVSRPAVSGGAWAASGCWWSAEWSCRPAFKRMQQPEVTVAAPSVMTQATPSGHRRTQSRAPAGECSRSGRSSAEWLPAALVVLALVVLVDGVIGAAERVHCAVAPTDRSAPFPPERLRLMRRMLLHDRARETRDEPAPQPGAQAAPADPPASAAARSGGPGRPANVEVGGGNTLFAEPRADLGKKIDKVKKKAKKKLKKLVHKSKHKLAGKFHRAAHASTHG